MKSISTVVLGLDWLNERIGRAVAWLILLMALNVAAAAVLRHVFGVEFIWLREAYTWMHGLVFMLGAGYTLLHDGHLRVDAVYRSRNARSKAIADLFGVIFFLIPFIAMVAWVSWPYVAAAWERFDGAREIGGLPGLFLLKTVILVFCLLVGLLGLALAGRSLLVLGGHPGASRPGAPRPGAPRIGGSSG